VVATVLGRTGFTEQWHREVRWSRCARVSRPWCYPGLFICFTIPLALLLLLLSGFATIGWYALVVSLVVRWLAAFLISGYTGDIDSRRWLPWLPIRDLLSALVWLVGGLGRHIIWRGDRFILHSDGRMEPVSRATPGWLAELWAWRP
jgi:ceramide glucosyltransferase